MYVMMRETESGKLWPIRLFENKEAFEIWLEEDDIICLWENGVGAFFLVEASFYTERFYPNIVEYEYDLDECTYIMRNTVGKCWHADEDYW